MRVYWVPGMLCVWGIITLAIAPHSAAAYDLGCQYTWEGPGVGNDLVECLSSYPERDPGMLVPTGVAVLLCILLGGCFPLCCCCRCCGGCGSDVLRPGADCCCGGEDWDELPEVEKQIVYPPGHVSTLKCLTIITFVASWLSVALVAMGYRYMSSSVDFLLRESKASILDWIRDTMLGVQKDIVLSDGSFIPPITADTFAPVYDIYNLLYDWHTYLTEQYDQYGSNVQLGFILVASVPSALFLGCIFVAYCNVRKCLPKAMACLFFFLGIVCALLGILLLTVGVFGTTLCGEVSLQDRKLPGIFQWYVVPQCEDQLFLTDLRHQLRTMEAEKAQDACLSFDGVCGPGSTYNYSKPDELFQCRFVSTSNNVDPAIIAACSTLTDSINIIESSPMKSGNPICANCQTVYDCAAQCTDANARNTSIETVQNIQIGKNASRVLNKLLPVLDCDGLLTRVFIPLRKCSDLSFGAFCVGCGACWAVLLFIWEIVIMLKGAKLFFDPEDVRTQHEEDDEFETSSDDDSSGRVYNNNKKRNPPPPISRNRINRAANYTQQGYGEFPDDVALDEDAVRLVVPSRQPTLRTAVSSSPPPKMPPTLHNNYMGDA